MRKNEQLDPLCYYFDVNTQGEDLCSRLVAKGMSCVMHRDHFPNNAEDVAWIPEIASRGWVIVTRDAGIQTNPAEREALINACAIAIIIRR